MNACGANGDKAVSPVHAELKDLTERLSDEEAAVVLRVAREVAGSGRKSPSRLRDLEARADAQLATEALADPARIPYAEVRRQRGR